MQIKQNSARRLPKLVSLALLFVITATLTTIHSAESAQHSSGSQNWMQQTDVPLLLKKTPSLTMASGATAATTSTATSKAEATSLLSSSSRSAVVAQQHRHHNNASGQFMTLVGRNDEQSKQQQQQQSQESPSSAASSAKEPSSNQFSPANQQVELLDRQARMLAAALEPSLSNHSLVTSESEEIISPETNLASNSDRQLKANEDSSSSWSSELDSDEDKLMQQISAGGPSLLMMETLNDNDGTKIAPVTHSDDPLDHMDGQLKHRAFERRFGLFKRGNYNTNNNNNNNNLPFSQSGTLPYSSYSSNEACERCLASTGGSTLASIQPMSVAPPSHQTTWLVESQ